jgi:hypothetical protein
MDRSREFAYRRPMVARTIRVRTMWYALIGVKEATSVRLRILRKQGLGQHHVDTLKSKRGRGFPLPRQCSTQQQPVLTFCAYVRDDGCCGPTGRLRMTRH